MNLKLILTVMTTALLFGFSKSVAQNPLNEADKILGVFWSPKKDAKIEIYKRGKYFYGKSIWVMSPRKDNKNPNVKLQKREILGIELLANFIYNDGEYSGGTIYDPESGKTYNCKMSLNGNSLKVRGYVGISLFGRTETFTRTAG